MRVIVDACTSSRSASALTVCGPSSDTTPSVRSCGSVTSSLTDASARTVMPTSAAGAHDGVDDVGGAFMISAIRLRSAWNLLSSHYRCRPSL